VSSGVDKAPESCNTLFATFAVPVLFLVTLLIHVTAQISDLMIALICKLNMHNSCCIGVLTIQLEHNQLGKYKNTTNCFIKTSNQANADRYVNHCK